MPPAPSPALARRLALADDAATAALGETLAALARPGDALLLSGPLGAGKTSLARAFLRHLTGDPALEVPSPSFTLVQEYATQAGPVHHFDLWRLAGPEGLAELGWDQALDGIVLVEWPERLGHLTPGTALRVMLEYDRAGGDTAGGRTAHLAGWLGRLGPEA